MSSEQTKEMRSIMSLIEDYTSVGVSTEPVLVEEIVETPKDHPVLDDLRDLVFKLRAHTENDDGDRALGIEEGMQMAADMIENLLRRHQGD